MAETVDHTEFKDQLLGLIEELVDATTAKGQAPAPVVNVPAPVVNVPPITVPPVNIPAPVVNPQVNIPDKPAPKGVRVSERDRSGKISELQFIY